MKRCLVLLSAISLSFAGAAVASVQQGDVELDAMGGYIAENGVSGGGDKTAWFVSAAIGYFLTDNIQVAGVGLAASTSEIRFPGVDSDIYALGVRGRYHFMPQNQLVPFVGAQFLWAQEDSDYEAFDTEGILWGPEVGARMSLNQVTDVYGVVQYHIWDGNISDSIEDGWGIFFGLVHKFK
jgi:hypothetical protein